MSTPAMYERKLKEIEEKDARIAELENALRPFAAATRGADEIRDFVTQQRGNACDGTSAYVWHASRSLCVADFKTAKAVLAN